MVRTDFCAKSVGLIQVITFQIGIYGLSVQNGGWTQYPTVSRLRLRKVHVNNNNYWKVAL